MSRLIFHLSGKVPNDFVIRDDDYIFHSSVLDKSRVLANSSVLSYPDIAFEKDLCERYTRLFCNNNGGINRPLSDMEFCFLNDYYSYSVRPIFSQMLAVKELCDMFPGREVLILYAKTSCSLVPMLGFQTTESKRGSQDLLGSVTAKQMKRNKVFQSAKFVSLNGDTFCNESFRKMTLRLANFVFSLLFVLKATLAKSHRGNTVDGKPVVLYRNVHQERFAKKLALSGEGISLLYIPQLTQGALRPTDNSDTIQDEVNEIGLSLRDILVSLKNARVLARDFRKELSKEAFESDLEVDGVSIKLNRKWVASELRLISIVFIYSAFLTRILKKSKVKKLINFELVGRMAGIEAMCSKSLGIEVATVQTALVASRPHPVFPYSTRFFSDSEETARMISDNGVVACGSVEFAGVLERTKLLRTPERFRRIVFYTQPYEPEITRRLLSTLRDWADRNDAELKIKLHPRDDASAYGALGFDAFYVDQGVKITELYDWADLTVTRTSSVAKESLSRGCPILLNIWSTSEKSIKADYINPRLAGGYISNDLDSFKALLSTPSRLIEANLALRAWLFGHLGPEDLLNAIINE